MSSASLRKHKAKVAVLVVLYFALGYGTLAVLNEHRGHAIQAATWIDHALPLLPIFIIPYFLGDLFVFLGLVVLDDRREINASALVMVGMLTVAFLTFYFFPIEMHKQIASGQDWLSRLTRFQQTADTGFNTFPSLHVALNTFAYLVMIRRRPELRWPLFPLLVLIILSTLFVKQHLVVDVLGGLVLALAGYAVYLRLLRAAPKQQAS